MENINVDENEKDIIKRHFKNFLPTYLNDWVINEKVDALYNDLFDYKDLHKDRILNKPLKHNLEDIFNELKFGRTAEDQIFLDLCVSLLTEKNDNKDWVKVKKDLPVYYETVKVKQKNGKKKLCVLVCDDDGQPFWSVLQKNKSLSLEDTIKWKYIS